MFYNLVASATTEQGLKQKHQEIKIDGEILAIQVTRSRFKKYKEEFGKFYRLEMTL